jgi:NADH-quinone oxidoreductase subunit F
VAASAVGADRVIVGMKKSFTDVARCVRSAIDELDAAGWTSFASIKVFEGPGECLLGEETALLESIDGRHPFPRVTPPYRRGVNESRLRGQMGHSESGSAAQVELAGPTRDALGSRCLVNNVETLAHCALTLANGAAWFRQLGTVDSPGTAVCTVSGQTMRAGVGEVSMGTPLIAVIDAVGAGARDGRHTRAVMQGVAAALITEDLLDTPVSWEGMKAAGSGLGSAAFMVYDEDSSMAAIATSASRFLAVESCGQCLHCKRDGLDRGRPRTRARLRRTAERPRHHRRERHHDHRLTTSVVMVAERLQEPFPKVGGHLVDVFVGDLAGHGDGTSHLAEVFATVWAIGEVLLNEDNRLFG